MKAYGRVLAFVMARVNAELSGAAANAANFGVSKNDFVALAGKVYDHASTLFVQAEQEDQRRVDLAMAFYYDKDIDDALDAIEEDDGAQDGSL